MIQIDNHGDESVKNLIKSSLIKLSNSIGDNIQNDKGRLETITEDLIDLYHYDSIEDLMECFKKGRRGQYGFGHHKRGYITMLLLRDWMTSHLDEKAEIREKELSKMKVDPIEAENFDAKKFYEIGAKFLKAQAENHKRRNSFSSATYDEIKHRYFEDQKNKSDSKPLDGDGV